MERANQFKEEDYVGQVKTAPDSAEEFRKSDVGNAKQFVKQHGECVRHIFKTGQWLIWDGMRWAFDDIGAIYQKSRETIQKLEAEAVKLDDVQKRIERLKFCLASESKQNIRDIVEISRSMPEISVRRDDFDNEIYLISFLNGTLDLRTMELREHRPADMMTKLVHHNFNPDASCPVWLKTISEIFDGDSSLIDYLQSALGYSISGDILDHYLFFLYGIGRNGKNTIMDLYLETFPEYGIKGDKSTILSNKETHPTGLADMAGARFVLISEVDDSKRVIENMLKELSSEKIIKARLCGKDFFTFRRQCKVFMYGNKKPTIKGQELGIWDKLKLIPFTQQFTDDNGRKDPHLPDKLRTKEEIEGFVYWVAVGAKRWFDRQVSEPEAVRTAVADYKQSMDDLKQFIDECCDVGECVMEPAKNLFTAYKTWASGDGNDFPFGKKRFYAELEERGFDRFKDTTTNGQLTFKGLQLIAQPL